MAMQNDTHMQASETTEFVWIERNVLALTLGDIMDYVLFAHGTRNRAFVAAKVLTYV